VNNFSETINNNYDKAFDERGQVEKCEIIVNLAGAEVEVGDEDGRPW